MIVNNIQPCPKLCLLMPLARVGARTDSTTGLQLQRGAWPISTTGIGVAGKMHYLCRGFCTLVLLVFVGSVASKHNGVVHCLPEELYCRDEEFERKGCLVTVHTSASIEGG